VAATGQSIPLSYQELIRLFSSRDRGISLNIPRQEPSHLQVHHPVIRSFRWVNQMASGGSHVTVFTVRISNESSPWAAVVRDECSPDENPTALESALDELQRGVESFLAEKLSQNTPVHSIRISLLGYQYHETDFKPHKYRFAIQFVLDDLMCDQQCHRILPNKLVGIPL